MGVVTGFLTSKWIWRIKHDSVMVAALTIIACYVSFILGEKYLKISGILCIVGLGIYLSAFMKVNLSHEIDHSVHTIWGFVGFSLESLIFFVCGTYIGEKIKNYRTDLVLTGDDIWKAVLF